MWTRRGLGGNRAGGSGAAAPEGAEQRVWREPAEASRPAAREEGRMRHEPQPVASIGARRAWLGGMWAGRGRGEEGGSGAGPARCGQVPFPDLTSPGDLGSGEASGRSSPRWRSPAESGSEALRPGSAVVVLRAAAGPEESYLLFIPCSPAAPRGPSSAMKREREG